MSSLFNNINPYQQLGNVGAATKPGNVVQKAATGGEAKPASDAANAVSEFKAILDKAETTALQAGVSQADPHAIVEALANAEVTLETAVTVRDKVVEAYQELLRMPI